MGGEKPTEAQQFVIMALDRQTGKVLWQQVAREEVPHEGYRQNDGSFASPSGLRMANMSMPTSDHMDSIATIC